MVRRRKRNPYLTARYRHKHVGKTRCARGSYRTIRIGRHGRLLRVCCPRGAWSRHSKRCRRGMRGYDLMTPRKRNPDSVAAYIRSLRKEAKRAYATRFYEWLRAGEKGSEPDHPGITAMGAQGVRLELYRLRNSNPRRRNPASIFRRITKGDSVTFLAGGERKTGMAAVPRHDGWVVWMMNKRGTNTALVTPEQVVGLRKA